MPHVKNIFGDLYAFASRGHSNEETTMFKILENKVLEYILSETKYLAMKCEHRSLIGVSTIKILFHKPHTAFLLISPTGATFKAQINFEWWLCTLRRSEDIKRVPCRDSNFLI